MAIIIKPGKLLLAYIIFRVMLALFFISVMVFCGYYLFSGHEQLAKWYLGLNNCFYRAQYWETDIFTKATKSDGNVFCIAGMFISLTGLFYISRKRKTTQLPKPPLSIPIHLRDIILALAGVAVGIFLWHWGKNLSWPAYDEVFSAQYVASGPPFQAIAYYMLPNNHLFYNLLNCLLFHNAADKVYTGRLISLAAYCIFIVILYFWFNDVFKNRFFAFIATITLALQFQVWGFGFQARGYEVYLLCEWGAFISLFYYLRPDNERWLLLNTACCALGYFCIPTFLFFHVTQLVFLLLYQLIYRKKGLIFWKYQLFTIAFAFLLYLPAFCFSGLKPMTQNGYVHSMDYYLTIRDFCKWFFFYLPNISGSTLSNPHWGAYPLVLWVYFVPVLLLLNRKNKLHVLLGLFYVILCLVFLAIVIAMKKPPFERNLIGHESITLAAIVLLIYWLTGFKIPRWPQLPRLILFPLCMFLLAFHFVNSSKELLKDHLYECDINSSYEELQHKLSVIPPGATVAFSDEAFYCYYICRKQGCIVHKCGTGAEEYFIKQTIENYTLPNMDEYTLFTNITDYTVYKRR